jgi:hypothetical protein
LGNGQNEALEFELAADSARKETHLAVLAVSGQAGNLLQVLSAQILDSLLLEPDLQHGAQRRVVRPLGQGCLFNGVGERFRHQPWGLFGGGPGGSGQFLIVEPDGSSRRIHDKPGEIRLSPEQALVVETPGAGGYGPPSGRSAEALAEDRASGKFTSGFMRRHYGAD